MRTQPRPAPADAPAGPSAALLAEVAAGLTAVPKRLPPKLFYDAEGSRLFERITQLPEYYPTRTELGILRGNAAAIAAFVPPGAALVEFGAGSSAKARVLLDTLPALGAYVPVDISGEFLQAEADVLRRDVPALRVVPVVADFTQPFRLPASVAALPRAGFFPGSTIGNFDPGEAEDFLRLARRVLGPGGALIVGVDLVKDADTLNAAYNDSAGVTAAFNLNVLARLNREFGADFALDGFEHRAGFDPALSRVEMHLVSRRRQAVRVAGRTVAFAPGETIHTENSYKYGIDGFRAMAARTGWRPAAVWTDAAGLFSIHALSG